MLLRLDPAIPLVWRDPTTLQLGVDPPLAVVPDVTPPIERLVSVLAAGVSESGYAVLARTAGATPRQAERLRELVAPGLSRPAPPPPQGRALVLGRGPVALGAARLLDGLDLRARDGRSPELVVLASDRVLNPVEHRAWLQRDVPHLPVVTGDAAIVVGPLVEPGTTACLHCVSLHRRDVDAAWPAIAIQLANRPSPADHPLRTAAAVALVARIVAARLRDGPSPGEARELRVEGDGSALNERAIAPHPECRCAAPPESDWARADAPAAPRRTSAARASDAPA